MCKGTYVMTYPLVQEDHGRLWMSLPILKCHPKCNRHTYVYLRAFAYFSGCWHSAGLWRLARDSWLVTVGS